MQIMSLVTPAATKNNYKYYEPETTYLGLKLRTPLVPAASPLSENIDDIKKMEDAGASAVVLYSLFEEQLRQDRAELHQSMEQGTESFAEALTYFPEPEIIQPRPRGISQAHRQGEKGRCASPSSPA